jgi:hypothetical protein
LHQRETHFLGRVTEDDLAVHLRPHHFGRDLPDAVFVLRHVGAAPDVPNALHERIGVRSIGAEMHTTDAAIFVGRADDDGTRTITKKRSDRATAS